MRTEIVIPFAFDTAPIEKLLEEQGEAEVMRILSEKVDSAVIANLTMKNDGYGYDAKKVPDWRGFLENRFNRWLVPVPTVIANALIIPWVLRYGYGIRPVDNALFRHDGADIFMRRHLRRLRV